MTLRTFNVLNVHLQIRASVEQILKYGKVVRPILGISFAPDQVRQKLHINLCLTLHKSGTFISSSVLVITYHTCLRMGK